MSLPIKVLVDSDILSLYFKKHPNVVSAAQDYLYYNSVFTFSAITRFEILRGMRTRNASTQLMAFDSFCRNNEVIPLDDQVIVCAADIYADLYKAGRLITDADILIAATAMVKSLPVVTNNQGHFTRISGLDVMNWAD